MGKIWIPINYDGKQPMEISVHDWRRFPKLANF